MRKLYRNYILHKLYITQTILIGILFFTFFYLNQSIKVFLSIFLSTYAIIICYLIKKNKELSIRSRQITILMLSMAIIGLTIYYLLGTYYGYLKSNITFGLWSINRFTLPIGIIIISSEIIRYRFAIQHSKITKILNIIAMILIDVIIYTQLYNVKELSDLLAITGFIIFASISCNLLYEYISPKYGCMPIIVYRLIMGLYSYIIPVVPNVYIFTRSVLRMVYPLIIYLILEFLFLKKIKGTELKKTRRSFIFTIITVILSVLLTMLVSCEFYYGIIVIGSGSMTGAINKGDTVIYAQFKNQSINKGDVIIFNNNGTNTVHRVIDVANVGNSYRYYTKGDANINMDNGYVEPKQIIGICKMKIKYIGYPSIWVKTAFDKK